MTMKKKCFKCGRRKFLRQFYRHPEMRDGHLNKCKRCTKKDVSGNYRSKLDYYKRYEKGRNRGPERKAAQAWYQKRRREKNPGKFRARVAISNAVRDGRLRREPCEVCGEKAQAHHTDYRKPFAVRWLCPAHHREVHEELAECL